MIEEHASFAKANLITILLEGCELIATEEHHGQPTARVKGASGDQQDQDQHAHQKRLPPGSILQSQRELRFCNNRNTEYFAISRCKARGRSFSESTRQLCAGKEMSGS